MRKRKPTPTVGQQIRAARNEAGMLQSELAEKVGLARGQTDISEIEREDKHVKSWRIIENIRRVLGMT